MGAGRTRMIEAATAGKVSKPRKNGPTPKDHTGLRYGRYLVLERAIHVPNGRSSWRVQCDCGRVRVLTTSRMLHSECCPCSRAPRVKLSTEHGMVQSHKDEYRSWASMRSRCLSPKSQDYRYYGARGITIDPRWDDFPRFVEDMGRRPKGMTLDRIDNDGPYTRTNCRWASRKVQSNNTRFNRKIQFAGKTLNLSEWAEITGIHPRTITCRMDKFHWPVARALLTEAHRGRRAGHRYG